MKRARLQRNQKAKCCRALACPACGLISGVLLKADAVALGLAIILSAQKMRLDDFAAVRLTAAHGQISFEEEIRRGCRR
jgi:hypothetical protein